MTYIKTVSSPVGPITLAGDQDALTGLWMSQQKYYGATLSSDTQEENLPVFEKAQQWLLDYFAGKRPPINFPLAPQGSEFRQKVWNILLDIPYGKLTTYGAIAKQLAQEGGTPASAQAVGGAVGHNPIGIIIPCHRVVGTNRSLTGYAGGLDKKVFLLELEGIKICENRVAAL